jgi:hypothetical protein
MNIAELQDEIMRFLTRILPAATLPTVTITESQFGAVNVKLDMPVPEVQVHPLAMDLQCDQCMQVVRGPTRDNETQAYFSARVALSDHFLTTCPMRPRKAIKSSPPPDQKPPMRQHHEERCQSCSLVIQGVGDTELVAKADARIRMNYHNKLCGMFPARADMYIDPPFGVDFRSWPMFKKTEPEFQNIPRESRIKTFDAGKVKIKLGGLDISDVDWAFDAFVPVGYAPEPIKVKTCDCGALIANTTHAGWCSTCA